MKTEDYGLGPCEQIGFADLLVEIQGDQPTLHGFVLIGIARDGDGDPDWEKESGKWMSKIERFACDYAAFNKAKKVVVFWAPRYWQKLCMFCM